MNGSVTGSARSVRRNVVSLPPSAPAFQMSALDARLSTNKKDTSTVKHIKLSSYLNKTPWQRHDLQPRSRREDPA